MQTFIVTDLGFGDCGKGAAIDSLAALYPNSIGIRTGGGHQCGHAVFITEKRKHIHKTFSSAALRGRPTYVGPACSMYPPALIEESKLLAIKKGNVDITFHPDVMITTPLDIAWNRYTEKRNQHGSVGRGVGATAHRHTTTPYKLYMVDTLHPEVFSHKFSAIKEYYLEQLSGRADKQIFFDYLEELATDDFKTSVEQLSLYCDIQPFEYLGSYDQLLFEGNQGILLDKQYGVYPNVTYANTTSLNALQIASLFGVPPIIFYVTRCYTTRHGNGWVPNQPEIELINNENEINFQHDWQGEFKVRELDYSLLNYAMKVDEAHGVSGLARVLVVSCLDQRPDFTFEVGKLHHQGDIIERRSHITDPTQFQEVLEELTGVLLEPVEDLDLFIGDDIDYEEMPESADSQ